MILTSGCFDGIHAGHVAFFQKLKAITNQNAYVAVADDAYILKHKGHEPKWGEAHRLAAVKGINGVQDAFLHDDRGVWHILKHGRGSLWWNAFAKGIDWFDPDDRDGATRLNEIRAACIESGVAAIFVDSGIAYHSSTR
jgi:glycerol-3-phosphate cytidylyltransferase-like family protein